MELNSVEIQKILPHRYPFLMVDRITECEPGVSAKGVKCVTANEMHFLGHFPGYPVMPGVLILEALGQVAAISVLTQEGNEGKLVFLGGIKNAKFKTQVQPGDVVELSAKITEKVGKIVFAECEAKVAGRLAVKMEVSLAIGERVS